MNDDVVVLQVGELVQTVRDLIQLLDDDRVYFEANALDKIEQNNEKKAEANERLENLITALATSPDLLAYSGNLYEKLLQRVEHCTYPSRARLDRLLHTLQDELMRYSRLLLINRQVVHANLGFIKDVFYALINESIKENQQPTYDRQGQLEQV